jgi:hypothetical protein
MKKTLENIVITALVAGIGILGFNSEIRADSLKVNHDYSNQSVPTYVNGKVYSGPNVFTPVIPNAIVDITCNGYTERDTADANGWYESLLPAGVGSLGETVTACIPNACGTEPIKEFLTNPLYIVGVDIFPSVPVSTNNTTWGRLKVLYK